MIAIGKMPTLLPQPFFGVSSTGVVSTGRSTVSRSNAAIADVSAAAA